MAYYKLVTPWQNETWTAGNPYEYGRLAGRRITGGSSTGNVPYQMTDIARGIALLITGTTVTATRWPNQTDLSNCDQYFLGGSTYTVDQSTANILINAGYSSYLTELPA